MNEIAPGVYVSSVYPGINVGLVVTGRWVIAVDAPSFPSDHQAWRKAARAIGRPIRYLILTDDHPDRLLGALWVGVPIIAGRGTWQKIRERGDGLLQALVEDWNRRHAPPGKPIPFPDRERVPLPELVVDGRVVIEDEVSVWVESVPGPSAGSLWVWLPRQAVLFTGDGAFHGHPSLSEAPSPTRWLEALTRLEQGTPPAQVVVPGRGPVGGPEVVGPLVGYLRHVHQRLQAALSRGKSPDLTAVAEELFQLFPSSDRERLLPQIRAGLEHWLEEMKAGN
ncbi:MAG: MBL fold metallo-hydrolase [Thermoflexales bacterium]|nr:MBL fold metallo-hydrolase [Thermoflexales bacterium]